MFVSVFVSVFMTVCSSLCMGVLYAGNVAVAQRELITSQKERCIHGVCVTCSSTRACIANSTLQMRRVFIYNGLCCKNCFNNRNGNNFVTSINQRKYIKIYIQPVHGNTTARNVYFYVTFQFNLIQISLITRRKYFKANFNLVSLPK